MTQSISPAPGLVLVEELQPEEQNELISGSSLEVTGGNPHDQLKLGRVLEDGDWPIESVKVLADLTINPRTEKYKQDYPISKKGDIIAFQSLSAHKLRVKGKQYLLVEFEHIKAIVEGAE